MELILEKNVVFFNFLGTDFVAPKSGHRREKQPVLRPDNYCCTYFVMRFFLMSKIVLKIISDTLFGPKVKTNMKERCSID